MSDGNDAYVTPRNALRRGQIVRRKANHKERGVVTGGPFRPGDRPPINIPWVGVGDVVIQQRPGLHTVTNIYDDWEQVPPEATSARERLLSRAETYEYPEWLDEGDEPQEQDSVEFAWIEALIPERVRDSWELDYPCSVFELLDALAQRLDLMAPPYEPEPACNAPTEEVRDGN